MGDNHNWHDPRPPAPPFSWVKDNANTVEKGPCAGYPSLPNSLPARPRVVVIGDIHGDMTMLLHLLIDVAKVIDDRGDWVAKPKSTVVIQLGDQIDSCRGPNCADEKDESSKANDLVILKFFTYLHMVAAKHDGGVYSLLGNHELMNVAGHFDYVSDKNKMVFDTFRPVDPKNKFKSPMERAIESRKSAFERGGEWSKFLACTRQSSITIGSWMFVHASITDSVTQHYKSIDSLNTAVRTWLLSLIDQDDNIEHIIADPVESPFWNRILGKMKPNEAAESCADILSPLIDVYHMKHLVIAHTPQLLINGVGINSTCGKKVWRVDTGAAAAFNAFHKKTGKTAVPQVMEIIDDTKVNILE